MTPDYESVAHICGRPKATFNYGSAETFWLHTRSWDGHYPSFWWTDENGDVGVAREDVPESIALDLWAIHVVKWLRTNCYRSIVLCATPCGGKHGGDESAIYSCPSIFNPTDIDISVHGNTLHAALIAAVKAIGAPTPNPG